MTTSHETILNEFEIYLEANLRHAGKVGLDSYTIYENILDKLNELQKEYSSKQNYQAKRFENGMTVHDLQNSISNWSNYGESIDEECTVWIEDSSGFTNEVFEIWPLNKRLKDDGTYYADLLLTKGKKIDKN